MWAGQTTAMVRRVQPAADIVSEIIDEARSVMSGLFVEFQGALLGTLVTMATLSGMC